MSDFRSAVGRHPRWHATGLPFSNFEFVDTRFGSNSILRRILSLARKLGFEGMLEEEIVESDCALLAAENAILAIRLPDFQGATVTRLSFFSSGDESRPGEFLGYAVVKQDRQSGGSFTHVYESVLRPPRGRAENNFCHAHREYRVQTGVGVHTVSGTIYAQQNDATFVCAHVALRTVLAALLPAGDIGYDRINLWAGVDHDDPARCVGGRGGVTAGGGLGSGQLEAVLTQAGFEPELVVHEPDFGLELPAGTEFQKLLYGFIESGRPALLGFQLTPGPNGESGRHIIPILGHTFNQDLWVPEAERGYFGSSRHYFPSESWLSAYVAHDDNFGPYVCLPRHYLGRSQFCLLVGLKPHRSALAADQAEALALDFAVYVAAQIAEGESNWFRRQLAFTRSELLVLRPLLVGREAYLAQLRQWRDREGFDLEPALADDLATRLPAVFWLVEVSAPELFPGSRRKFGEILVDPDPAGAPAEPVLLMRAPGLLVFPRVGGFDTVRTRLAGHTDLFRLS